MSFSLLLHFSVSCYCRGQNQGTRLGLPKGGSKSKTKDNVQETPPSSCWALELYTGWGQIAFGAKTTEIYLGRSVCGSLQCCFMGEESYKMSRGLVASLYTCTTLQTHTHTHTYMIYEPTFLPPTRCH